MMGEKASDSQRDNEATAKDGDQQQRLSISLNAKPNKTGSSEKRWEADCAFTSFPSEAVFPLGGRAL